MKNYVRNKIVYTQNIKYSHYFQILVIYLSATDRRRAVTARGGWAVLSLFDIHWNEVERRIQRIIILLLLLSSSLMLTSLTFDIIVSDTFINNESRLFF